MTGRRESPCLFLGAAKLLSQQQALLDLRHRCWQKCKKRHDWKHRRSKMTARLLLIFEGDGIFCRGIVNKKFLLLLCIGPVVLAVLFFYKNGITHETVIVFIASASLFFASLGFFLFKNRKLLNELTDEASEKNVDIFVKLSGVTKFFGKK